MMTCESVRKYTMALDDDGEIIGEAGSPEASHEAGIALDRQARSYSDTTGANYSEAFRVILAKPENSELAELYSGQPVVQLHAQSNDPGTEVDRLAKLHEAEHKVNYSEALHAVLGDPVNAQLKEEYER
jgi:hypothetical protein